MKQFRMGVGQATCALSSAVVVGESIGGKRFEEVGKLGVPCRELKASRGEISIRDSGLGWRSGDKRNERVLENQDIVLGGSRIFWGAIIGRAGNFELRGQRGEIW